MKCVLFLFVGFLYGSDATINCPSCTPLDELNFDKMINKFPASIVKFDMAYPYVAPGHRDKDRINPTPMETNIEFAKVAFDAAEIPQLFVGEVGIKDYGDKENEALGEKYKVTKDDMPVVFLFIKNAMDGTITNHRFHGDIKVGQLKRFIRHTSGIYLPLRGVILEFDKLADKLIKATDKDDKKKILREAEDEWDKVQGMKGQRRAEVYVKVMRKVLNEGAPFVKKEKERVKKLMEGNMSIEMKEDMQERVNILESFALLLNYYRTDPISRPKDEL